MEWSDEEQKAINSLKRLAKKWPASLTLFSASGSLVVMRTDDFRSETFVESRVESIYGIKNDGGDPDWEFEHEDEED